MFNFDSNSQKSFYRRILWYLVIVVFCLLLVPYFRSLFVELGLRWLYIFLFSLFLSYILTPVMRLIALRLNIVDMPGRRKIHEKSVPLLGGGVIVIAFISALLEYPGNWDGSRNIMICR